MAKDAFFLDWKKIVEPFEEVYNLEEPKPKKKCKKGKPKK